MISDVITYLNAKLEVLGYFNNIICLAERIEREGKVYPALYASNGEYAEINLDVNGSVCYWRKSGDVTVSEEDNSSGIGVQYKTIVPLKFVGFLKKETSDYQYFADNLIAGIIGNLTVNNSALKAALKAKTVRVTVSKYTTDRLTVGKEEYDNINFEALYTHAYFSIDFVLTFVTNTQCYTDICDNLPFTFSFPAVTQGLTFQELTLVSGTVDGVNATFTFDASPIQVFNSGVLKFLGVGYTLSGNSVIFDASYIPFIGDLILTYGYK